MAIIGTSGADEFLLRAASTALDQTATNGFVAELSSGDVVDRYDYDDSIENLEVDGGLAADSFTLDDNAAPTHIIGGNGNDVVQVGQLYGLSDCEPDGGPDSACTIVSDEDSVRGAAVGVVDGQDYFMTTVITRGHLSNGVTHPLIIDGDAGNDTITVFANNAPVTANGGAGNDNFVARAFIITASLVLNGDGDIDDFKYVKNDLLSIDGGDGTDTYTVIGTEANDGFIIGVDESGELTVDVCKIDGNGLPDPGDCAIESDIKSVEMIAAIGLEGDDVFWVQATIASSLVELYGGEHSDRFVIGDGLLSAINGPILVSGDDAGSVPAIPAPVVLPGEDVTPAFAPAVTGGSDRGDSMLVDGTEHNNGLSGEITSSLVIGFDMASGPFTFGSGVDEISVPDVLSYNDLEFVAVELGSGNDVVLISSTHVGNSTCDSPDCPLVLKTGPGNDLVDVQAIAGETEIDLGSGDDTVTVGMPDTIGDLLDEIDAGLTVLGGPDIDYLDLDNIAAPATRLDIDPGLITEASLAPAGVSHSAVEFVDIRLGVDDDVVNIRGTAADATETHVHGNGGNERFYVSSAAFFTLGTSTDYLGGDLDDVNGPLFIHGDGGDDNLLMISDREAGAGDGAITAVTYDGAALTGLAPAPINHDIGSSALGGGITIWSSEHADTIVVTGTDLSTAAGTRTLTTLNTGDGDDLVNVTLTDGSDGAFVLNTEEGADTVDGSTSSLGLIVFGGLGPDDLTTGSGNDIILGDVGIVKTQDGNTIVGHGGPGDITDGGTQPFDIINSDTTGGDADVISSGEGDDVVIAGAGADEVDGGAGEDVIAGDYADFDAGILTLLDIVSTALAASVGLGGDDTIHGGRDDDEIYGQQGNDDLFGDGGDDIIEGNSGSDTISGGDGQDDLIGGGSALDGVLDDDRSWTVEGVGLADDNDTIDGDDGADVLLGDNGWIQRTFEGDGTPTTLADIFGEQNPTYNNIVVRTTVMSDFVDPDGSFGADLLRGGDGPDELYGQLDTTRTFFDDENITIEGDELLGGDGEDVLLGDLGSVLTVLEDGSDETEIASADPFLSTVLRSPGTLTREVTLFLQQDRDHVDEADGSDSSQFGAEGDDLLLGGDGDDVIHGGSGDDIANGGAGADVVFGGDGNDAIWGGPGDDELFGGHDEDSIDVRPRDFTTKVKKVILGPDPDIWFEAAPSADALAGLDIAYGGWNTDELQADVQVNGKQPGDRLVDWNGDYNRYLGCAKGKGAGTFYRIASPSARAFFEALVEGRGALGASGLRPSEKSEGPFCA